MKIENKIAIVTGASSGIGAAIARELSSKGAKVVLSARSKDKLEKLAAELPGSIVIQTDMRKLEDIKKLISETVKKFGRVDILVNNAGQGMYGLVEKIDLKLYQEIITLNIFGPLLAMQEVIPQMRQQGGGLIMNISSRVTKMNIPMLAAYSSTKYALNSLTLTARAELEKDKIVVCEFQPRMTATEFGNNAISSTPVANYAAGQPNVDTAEQVAVKAVEQIENETAEEGM